MCVCVCVCVCVWCVCVCVLRLHIPSSLVASVRGKDSGPRPTLVLADMTTE